MSALVTIEMGIIALAAWSARGPLRQAALPPVQPPEVVRVSLGPMIDMDNRRRDEDEAKERKRKEELREQYRSYGYYTYPPGGYPYTYPPYVYSCPSPRNGYNYYPRGGLYPYTPNSGYYRDPGTGQYYHYYVNPPSGYPSNKDSNRPNQ